MPTWGDSASGVQQLWERGATGPHLHSAPGARLDAEFGYGFGALRDRSVLTPYGGLSLVGEAARGYRLGGRLVVGQSGNREPGGGTPTTPCRRADPRAPVARHVAVLVSRARSTCTAQRLFDRCMSRPNALFMTVWRSSSRNTENSYGTYFSPTQN